MALTIQDLDAYTNRYIVAKMTDTIFKQSPVFVRLHTQRMENFNGGTQIQRPIIIGELNGGAVGRGEGMNVDFVTTESALVNDMKVYWVGVTLFGFDSMKNDGPLAVFSQVQAKFLNAALKMGKLLATDMYLDSVAPRTRNITGFNQWVDDGNLFPVVGQVTRNDVVAIGTVGGLNAYTATITSFTLPQLNTAYGAAWFGPEHVDIISATQPGWNLVWQAMQPNQRHMDTDSDVGQAGFQSLRFNAAEIVIDQYLPTGTNGRMYGLNTKYIEWYFSKNPKFQFGWTGFKEAQGSIDVAGQFLVGNEIVVPNPRANFKLISTQF